jgi:hypothetical protein
MYFSSNFVISLHLRGEYVRRNVPKQQIFVACAKMLTPEIPTKYLIISDRSRVVERVKIMLGNYYFSFS